MRKQKKEKKMYQNHQKITEHYFVDEMKNRGFTSNGSAKLFEVIKDIEEDINEEINFDPIAINEEWNELTYKEFMEDFKYELKDYEDIGYNNEEIIKEFLDDNTEVYKLLEDTVLFEEF